jgi:hypothetical protein
VLYGLVVLAYLVDEASARAREHERKAAQLETSLAEARLHALELQTQPHFLFNTLNGIAALVRAGQPREALTMIGGLSDLLRYALDRAGEDGSTRGRGDDGPALPRDPEPALSGSSHVRRAVDPGAAAPPSRRCCSSRWSRTPSVMGSRSAMHLGGSRSRPSAG